MKVLMINVVCGIRSTGRICTDLAQALDRRGHEVKIAYGRERVPEQFQKYAVKIGSELDVIFHGIEARIFDRAGFGSKSVTKKFIKWINEYNPDVIHLHNIHGYYINIEVLFTYLKSCGKRIIWTLHDCWSFTGHTVYCDAISCNRWEHGCYSCPMINKYPAALIDRAYSNWLRKKTLFKNIPNMMIVTPSQWLFSWVKKSYLHEYPVKIINNGIDMSRFYPMESNFRKKNGLEDKFILLGVATSWDEMKGYSDFFKLAEKLDDSYQVVLVGLSKSQKKNLPKNILGIEKTDNVKELAELYTAANLFVNLSYCENYPTVNIEAMACATPVLTYRSGGSPEIVKKYGGIIVEKGDIDKIVENCNKIKNSVERISMNFQKEENDNSSVISNYIKLYS